MTALEVFQQQNGELTKAYYERMNALGPAGRVAVALFRAQKRSSRAKDYRGGRYRRLAYDVKQWSIDELVKLLSVHAGELGIFTWGWKDDPHVTFDGEVSWVLYVDLPQGQVSFHCPHRGKGPFYLKEWDGAHKSAERILAFCDHVEANAACSG